MFVLTNNYYFIKFFTPFLGVFIILLFKLKNEYLFRIFFVSKILSSPHATPSPFIRKCPPYQTINLRFSTYLSFHIQNIDVAISTYPLISSQFISAHTLIYSYLISLYLSYLISSYLSFHIQGSNVAISANTFRSTDTMRPTNVGPTIVNSFRSTIINSTIISTTTVYRTTLTSSL